ncbi:MAG: BirA family transcriptional regulator [Chloroflexota bacterium]|jgi:BirA family biotin operon repressor/biotin-[acetyl-CoA-carboxylase] ligase|nr:BirA family transcriptional regulator [Chloroflexota bacterium]
MEPADLGAWLRTAWLGRENSYHEVLGSTQDEARGLAAGGAAHGYLVWAGEQTRGRGRLDRRWDSPAGTGLWFSFIVRPGVPAHRMAALPLAVGAAVAAALDVEAPGRVRLKWPNDLLLDGLKVAGILVEGQVADGRLEYAVVGVGVNLVRPPGGFDPVISSIAAALADATGVAPSPARILAALLASLETAYAELLAHGPGAARRRWLELSDTIGRDVVAHLDGAEVRGRAVDLDPDGSLVLDTVGGRRAISFGEIQHLR